MPETASSTDPFVDLNRAAELLVSGHVCAFPTETVYGLGGDATNSDAVLDIYETKGRPRFNPLIVHCADVGMAERLVVFDDLANRLADAFWPGPLTLVLPMQGDAGLSDVVTAGLDTVGIRIPAHPLARELIARVGRPLAAPSANPSGRLSPTTAGQVVDLFGGSVPVLDGGPCEAGVESTILAIDDGRVVQLRAGALAREVVESELQLQVLTDSADSTIRAPGMLASHYAPRAMLRLNAEVPEAGEAYLAFGEMPGGSIETRNLSVTRDLREAARNLFAMLHELDALGVSRIAVAPVPESGLGEAINDRLRRAAAPRG